MTEPNGVVESDDGVRLAPYLLARLAAVPYPAVPAGSAQFRRVLDRLVGLRERLEATAGPLADALHDSAGQHSGEFHRKVVLPLRRDVHNRRQSRKARLAVLADLPERVPGLPGWLDAMAELAGLQEQLAAAAPAALAAERTVLSAVCRAEPLRRAVTLVGTDLLRGVDRQAAAEGDPDARTRKAEPNVLRYALRVSAKTSPLSWFTHVAWGDWVGDGTTGQLGGEPVAVTQVNRTLLTGLTGAILALPRLRPVLRYRLAPAVDMTGEVVTFRRDVPVSTVDRLAAVREEKVELARVGPLSLLIEQTRAAGPPGILLADLAAALAARLPGPADQVRPAAERYVEKMRDAGVVVPVQPVHPQDPQAVTALATWLGRHREHQLAGLLREIDQRTRQFGRLPAPERVAALAELRAQWSVAFAAAGAELGGAEVLTEDVGVRQPVRLGRAYGRDAAADLARLAALAELFDFQVLVRRLIRDRFVARYGVGGQCREVAEFSSEVSRAWLDSAVVSPTGVIRTSTEPAEPVSTQVRRLAEIRAGLTAQIRSAGGAEADEVTIPEAVLREAAQALPDWVGSRPASYCFFVQPTATSHRILLTVNHIYSGWGKFASRFLELVDPSAVGSVAAQVRRTLGVGARVGQLRPVAGFNANLHPLLVPDEVAEDARWATIGTDQIWLRHDPATDQVRLCLADTGELLDVLYLGLLIPLALPDRLSPIYSDLGGGPVTLAHLVAEQHRGGSRFRPRLRYRDLVVSRRRWQLPAEQTATLQAELAADGPVPADVVAGWRARLGLPAEVFVRAPDQSAAASLQALREYFYQPKPQYADLRNALHLRCLPRLLARHADGICVEEALPVPGRDNPEGRVVELMLETYREGRAR